MSQFALEQYAAIRAADDVTHDTVLLFKKWRRVLTAGFSEGGGKEQFAAVVAVRSNGVVYGRVGHRVFGLPADARRVKALEDFERVPAMIGCYPPDKADLIGGGRAITVKAKGDATLAPDVQDPSGSLGQEGLQAHIEFIEWLNTKLTPEPTEEPAEEEEPDAANDAELAAMREAEERDRVRVQAAREEAARADLDAANSQDLDAGLNKMLAMLKRRWKSDQPLEPLITAIVDYEATVARALPALSLMELVGKDLSLVASRDVTMLMDLAVLLPEVCEALTQMPWQRDHSWMYGALFELLILAERLKCRAHDQNLQLFALDCASPLIRVLGQGVAQAKDASIALQGVWVASRKIFNDVIYTVGVELAVVERNFYDAVLAPLHLWLMVAHIDVGTALQEVFRRTFWTMPVACIGLLFVVWDAPRRYYTLFSDPHTGFVNAVVSLLLWPFAWLSWQFTAMVTRCWPDGLEPQWEVGPFATYILELPDVLLRRPVEVYVRRTEDGECVEGQLPFHMLARWWAVGTKPDNCWPADEFPYAWWACRDRELIHGTQFYNPPGSPRVYRQILTLRGLVACVQRGKADFFVGTNRQLWVRG